MSDTFTNEQVLLDNLPKIEDVHFEAADHRYLKLLMWSTSIFFTLAFVIGLVLTLWFNDNIWITVAILCSIVLLATLILWLEYKTYQRIGYAVRQHDILFRSGVIWQKRVAVPFNRVQHCEIGQGPFERYFNLATLKIYTAGGSSSDLEIPGLQMSHAENIKNFIIQKKENHANEEE